MTFDEFSTYITYVLDYEIPPELLEGLNLGVIASPRLERNKKKSPPNLLSKVITFVIDLANKLCSIMVPLCTYMKSIQGLHGKIKS